jgi:transcriptional regulator with XRE-family HTH domain
MKLGEVLKKYRLFKEMTLRELAEEIGVSAPTMLRLERGKAPDARTLMLILNWLTAVDTVDK